MKRFPSLRRALPVFAFLSTAAAASAQNLVGWGAFGLGDVPPEAQTGVIAFDAGPRHSLAVKSNGRVVAWGEDGEGCCDVPEAALSGVVAVATAFDASYALKSDGTVLAWGDPVLTNLPEEMRSDVVAISGGQDALFVLKSDGRVLGFGRGTYGELAIPSEASSGVVMIRCGGPLNLALKADGTLLQWGSLSDEYPIPPAARVGLRRISTKAALALGLTQNGSLVYWGGDFYHGMEVPDAAKTEIASIAAGAFQFCVARKDGRVVAWGDNLGEALDLPASVQSGVLEVSAGYFHSLALRADAWATLDQTQVYGGDSATGTVHLANPAGPGGTEVRLVSSSPAVHVPKIVTVPEGATERTFPVFTDPQIGDTDATVQTSFNGSATVPAALRLKGVDALVAVDRWSVYGGATTPLNVTARLASPVSQDLTLSLLSSDASVKLPATVTIPAGQTSVTVPATHELVGAPKAVTVSGAFAGRTFSPSVVNLLPLTASVTFAANPILSGESGLGFVSLNAAIRNALTVGLATSDPRATVPATLRISAGGRTGYFSIASAASATNYTFSVRSTVIGNVFSSTLKALGVPSVTSIILPASVNGSTRVAGSVSLSVPAGPDGETVALSSSDPSLQLPATVFVPEGSKVGRFEATIADISMGSNVRVTATGRRGAASRDVALAPQRMASFTLSESSIKGGQPLTGTVTLRMTVAVDTVVNFSSTSSVLSLPVSVTIPAGASSATFGISTRTVTKSLGARIAATKGDNRIERALKIVP